MKTVDDRTPEQRETHTIGIVARDPAMSGWGGAKGGYSRACWAVDPTGNVTPERVFDWVKARGDMQYVSMVDLRTYRPPRGTAHFHVYVVTDSHSSAPSGVRLAAENSAR